MTTRKEVTDENSESMPWIDEGGAAHNPAGGPVRASEGSQPPTPSRESPSSAGSALERPGGWPQQQDFMTPPPPLEPAIQPTEKIPPVERRQRSDVSTPPMKQPQSNQPAWGQPSHSNPTTPATSYHVADLETHKMAVPVQRPSVPETPAPASRPVRPNTQPLARPQTRLTRGRALFLGLLLMILIINATTSGFSQFFGPRGWGMVFNSSTNNGQKLLQQIHRSAKPGTTATPVTADTIVDNLLANMTLDQKLGQLMLVQFTGPEYSLDISTMLTQYHVGSVLLFTANNNIVSKPQLTGLISQMQQNADLPLTVSIDQEGGYVDRLVSLDDPQPPESTIGASGDPNKAYQQGVTDAQNLASYGFNLNLAPVIDVTNVASAESADERTYGNNPTLVTQMASAYLQGLQKSGKVFGTLKHFPGLGDVPDDPHIQAPDLTRSLTDLNAIDWAPYKALIAQGNVYAIMVTHEYVTALDDSEPSSLSPKVISVLRNQFNFQGVIMTDSLTMDSIHNYYTYGEAAAKAIEAGDDLLMGATSPSDVAQMLDGIRQAMSSGAITQQRIDDFVRRILLLKYRMGLLHV